MVVGFFDAGLLFLRFGVDCGSSSCFPVLRCLLVCLPVCCSSTVFFFFCFFLILFHAFFILLVVIVVLDGCWAWRRFGHRCAAVGDGA